MKGFDNLSLNHQLLYAVSLDEYAAGATPPSYDKARPHHISTLHGGAWNSLASGLPYIDLSPNPDFIDCPAAATADLDFTIGDFSGVLWINPDVIAQSTLLCKHTPGAPPAGTGWDFRIGTGPWTAIRTWQAGGNQQTNGLAGDIAALTWQLVGFNRSGAACRIFVNGLDCTSGINVHTDPDSAAASEFHLGVYNDEVSHPFDGKIAGGECCPRIWGRTLSPSEMLAIFNMERHWFGV